VIAVVQAAWSGPRIVRRVVELGFLSPDGSLTTLALPASATPDLQADGLAALSAWSTVSPHAIRDQVAAHATVLSPRLA
jgi:hypothetical protein